MINRENVVDVIQTNWGYLNIVEKYVEEVQAINLAFRFKPIEAIKNYLSNHADANLLMFPSEEKSYGGLVTYRNGRFYIHINTNQPRTYENFIWAHEFFHFYFEQDKIRSADVQTYADGSVPSATERMANLFAAELLINKYILRVLFEEYNQTFEGAPLAHQVIRLMKAFELPYKSIVVKLAQDRLISLEDAVEIIDYDYRNNLPVDFDKSLLVPSMSIQLNTISELLDDEKVKDNLRVSDYDSVTALYNKRMEQLRRLRDKKKE